jgi:hypothetical protein
MSPSEVPTRALTLSLIAAILILINSALVGAAATWFPWVIPTLPGNSGNDTTVLYDASAVGLICGVLVLLGAMMLRSRSTNRKVWGVVVMVFSIPSVLSGGGFVIGFILGIIGGALALSAKPKMQVADSATTRT